MVAVGRSWGIMKRPAAVLTTLLLAIGLLAAPPPSTVSAAPRDIDNSSLESVRDAYLTWLRPALSAPWTWDGDPSKCVSGSPSPQNQPAEAAGAFSPGGRAATLEAINYYREMAGLQPVTEYAPGSHLAQQAALIMHANNLLTHTPTSSLACYSKDGEIGAGTSNLYLGRVGARAADGFVDDPGANNVLVGHRRWVLYPPLSGVGIGSTDKSTSLVVFDSGSQNNNPRPSGGTPWPSAGYVPWETMPTSGRWSYGAPRGTNFSNATITMTKNGSPWPVQVTRSNELYGDPAVVWTGGPITEPAGDTVDTYDITVAGIPGGPIHYQVKTFRAAVARVGSVTVAGDPSVGNTLTATANDPQPSDAYVSYAWYADGDQVGSARTYSVAASDVGKQLVVKATAALAGWANGTTSSSALTVKPGVLKPQGVGIDGTPVVGQSLSFVKGNWGTGLSPTFSLQWLRNDEAIPGAVSSPYLITAADLGTNIALRVTGMVPGYTSATVTTGSVGPVTAPVTPTPTPTPPTPTPTSPSPTPTTPAPTPTTPAPTPTTPTTPTTPPSPPKKFTNVPTPTISGTAQVGKILTAKPGSWSPAPSSFQYQWYRNGKAITGATGRTYTLAPAIKGGTVTVRVTAARTGYATTTSKPSKTTKKVKVGTITAVKPKISGTVRIGHTLTAVPGKWKPTTTRFAYQWYRNGSKIKKATKVNYLLGSTDKGKKISVKVTGKATGYTTKAKTSSKTGKVSA